MGTKKRTVLRRPWHRVVARRRRRGGILRRGFVVACACAAVVVGAGGVLRADVLRLKNGEQVEGRVSLLPSGDYLLTIDEGQNLTIRAADVVKRIKAEAPIDAFHRRLVAIAAGDRDALVELAAWAEEKHLRKAALAAYRRILQIDPNHAGARERLGYVLFRNRWVLRRDLQKSGMIQFRGEWMTPEERDRRKRKEVVEEFKTLLADAHNANRYLAENALVNLYEQKDPALLEYLGQLIRGDDPLDRMVAARVLANLDFARAAPVIYAALLCENRPEVVTAMIAVLSRYHDPRVGEWAARDLARAAQLEERAVTNLLRMQELCPYRDAIPALISLLGNSRYQLRAQHILTKNLHEDPRSPAEWRTFWQAHRATLPLDLNSGWLKDGDSHRSKSSSTRS